MNAEEPRICIVLLAGGQGTRLGASTPKQFVHIHGKPLWFYAAATFDATFPDAHWVLVFPKRYHREVREHFLTFFPHLPDSHVHLADGGETRFHSVSNALPYCPEDSIVFVHDAARCFVDNALLLRLYECALTNQTAIPCIVVRDSVRIIEDQGLVAKSRDAMRLVQTPQVFQHEVLKKSYLHQHYQDRFSDDATVVESEGFVLHWVNGDYRNFKITFAEDIPLAEKLLADFKV